MQKLEGIAKLEGSLTRCGAMHGWMDAFISLSVHIVSNLNFESRMFICTWFIYSQCWLGKCITPA